MELVYNVVATIVIPFVVEIAKKLKVPTKAAPFVAIALGIVYAAVSSLMGQSVDAQAVLDALLQGLGVGGVAVALYDAKKSITG